MYNVYHYPIFYVMEIIEEYRMNIVRLLQTEAGVCRKKKK